MRIPDSKKSGGRPHLQTSVDDPYIGDPDYVDVTQMGDSTKRYLNIKTNREIKTDIPVVHRSMFRGM